MGLHVASLVALSLAVEVVATMVDPARLGLLGQRWHCPAAHSLVFVVRTFEVERGETESGSLSKWPNLLEMHRLLSRVCLGVNSRSEEAGVSI